MPVFSKPIALLRTFCQETNNVELLKLLETYERLSKYVSAGYEINDDAYLDGLPLGPERTCLSRYLSGIRYYITNQGEIVSINVNTRGWCCPCETAFLAPTSSSDIPCFTGGVDSGCFYGDIKYWLSPKEILKKYPHSMHQKMTNKDNEMFKCSLKRMAKYCLYCQVICDQHEEFPEIDLAVLFENLTEINRYIPDLEKVSCIHIANMSEQIYWTLALLLLLNIATEPNAILSNNLINRFPRKLLYYLKRYVKPTTTKLIDLVNAVLKTQNLNVVLKTKGRNRIVAIRVFHIVKVVSTKPMTRTILNSDGKVVSTTEFKLSDFVIKKQKKVNK